MLFYNLNFGLEQVLAQSLGRIFGPKFWPEILAGIIGRKFRSQDPLKSKIA